MNYFISAPGTNCGKTYAAALLCVRYSGDYWKPVQCGRPADSEFISNICTPVIHPSAYILDLPVSPHHAADIQNVHINLTPDNLPRTENILFIEGAGGLYVPLNENQFMYDLPLLWNAELILIVPFYLGSINHTLMSLELIQNKKIPFAGIIFNGEPEPYTIDIIRSEFAPPEIGSIPFIENINRYKLKKLAAEISFTNPLF